MDDKSNKKIGGLLVGAGGISALLAVFCCGFPWLLAGLFAMLGVSFLLQDIVLIPIIILGMIIAFIGWRMLKK
jgi:hypothetical protein